MKEVRWIYSFTGGEGSSLFETLRDRDFEDLVEKQAEEYLQDTGWRECFVDEKLWITLTGDDLDTIVSKVPELQGKRNADVRKWLYSNKCPILDEDALRKEWAWERANWDAEDGSLWDFIDTTVSTLPDFQDIFVQIKEQWEKGVTGIIKVQHSTGEIWGWADRYPDKWVITIMYPEER